MKFNAESELVETLKTSLKKIYNRNNIQIFEEVSLGYGVADIVISDFKNQPNEPKEQSLELLDITVYSIILKSSDFSIFDLSRITRCSLKNVSKSVEKLLVRGYILKQEDKFFINKSYELPFRNNFAIEAKLKDWKRALKQAYRYKWFAEYSYVVLDKHNSKSALKNIDCFKKYNVGLASISPDGNLNRHFNPTREKPCDPKMQILFSEKIQKLGTA